LNNLAIKRH